MADALTGVDVRAFAGGRARLGKYAAVAAIALRQALADRSALVGRLAFYVVILLIFSRLWAVVVERGVLPGLSATDLLWYLATTEWVMLSLPLIHLQIEEDVRRGEVATLLPRPISYLGSRLAQGVGEALPRAATLALAGGLLAWALGGGLPADPRGLWLALPLGLAAIAVGLCAHAAIGVCAVWLHDCSPIYWVWQKLAFILGGLLLPLEVYPDWLREVALWTPFSALMHGPARMAFGWQPEVAAVVAAKLLLWGAVAFGILVWAWTRALRNLDVSGG